MSDIPGFKKLKVPEHNDLRPNMRDATPDRGTFAYARPVQHVYDLGAPRDALTDWRGVPSPASAKFKAGVPMAINPSAKSEQKSLTIQTGVAWAARNKKTNPET